ncbi:MAG: tetratricopeptide repeat protein [Planctomycetota bacterium]
MKSQIYRFPLARVLALALIATIGNGDFRPATAQDPSTGVDAAAPAEKNAGQSDFDQAFNDRFDAKTSRDLDQVAALLESAMSKGLDDDTNKMASEMLAAVLLQKVQQQMAVLVRSQGRRMLSIRNELIEDLEKATQADPESVEALVLKAQLLVTRGDVEPAKASISKAIELLGDDPEKASEALVVRAQLEKDADGQLQFFDRAIELNPDNLQARQRRGALLIREGEVEKGLDDLKKVLDNNLQNRDVAAKLAAEIADRLSGLGKNSEAIEILGRAIEAQPDDRLYQMRSTMYRREGDIEKAKADIEMALDLQPKNPLALLQRAEVALIEGDIKGAKASLQAATQLNRRVAAQLGALEIRANIAIAEKRYSEAIKIFEQIVERIPEPSLVNRLAMLYSLDERPRKAIELLTEFLEKNPDRYETLRSRGDAFLAVGEHDRAIKDYETALSKMGSYETIQKDESLTEEAWGLYNNLAWVLSTSPEDKVRNAKKSLEYGEKAAELSDYQEAHILSTLAAAYAENGNFEKAREWSKKAVEMAIEEDNPQLDQLKEELESYQQEKPWREKQDVKENELPILSPEDLIDT